MKRRSLLAILPILALASCSAEKINPYLVEYVDGLPVVSSRNNPSEYTTYLLMSPFGYLNLPGSPVKGEVSELFYENTIVWKADAGSELPGSDVVRTTVSGASFRGWAYYNEDN